MIAAGTYKITRQGQITIPASIREDLGLREGDVLDFFYADDVVLIKKKREPLQTFRALASAARKRFKERKLTAADIEKEIQAVRNGK